MMDYDTDLFDSDREDYEAFYANTSPFPEWKRHVRMYPTLRDKWDALIEKYGIALFVIAFAAVALLSRIVIEWGGIVNWLFGYSKGRK